MINLTKINGEKIIVNADEIEFVEYSYDTTIHLISGNTIIVKESPEEIRDKVINYRRICNTKSNDKI